MRRAQTYKGRHTIQLINSCSWGGHIALYPRLVSTYPVTVQTDVSPFPSEIWTEARYTYLETAMDAWQCRLHVRRATCFNEFGKASECLNLTRENIEERGGKNIHAWKVRYVGQVFLLHQSRKVTDLEHMRIRMYCFPSLYHVDRKREDHCIAPVLGFLYSSMQMLRVGESTCLLGLCL